MIISVGKGGLCLLQVEIFRSNSFRLLLVTAVIFSIFEDECNIIIFLWKLYLRPQVTNILY